ncbi:MAG TPA: transglutaminase family protein, partial [Gemmataceae bacterium]|nr:transglutaminase family protein [Gemmataceae bacterium]
KAFEKLAEFEKTGHKIALTPDEAALIEDARDGKLDRFSFAEACLIASGVTDAAARKKYLAELDHIEADARKSLDGAKTPREKGERLLKFLHAGPMAKGYEHEQTDLHCVLDAGTFNCVSSAVLYNVIGRRLGLDLVAVEVPEHVFAVLRDGDRKIDVETTNARGFDPTRDKRTKPDGAVSIAEKHGRDRREVGEAGLAAIIAYNHGVSLAGEKRHADALRVNFLALALDRDNPGAAKNAIADLTNWPLELCEAAKFEEALAVINVGLVLAPKHEALTNSQKAVWHDYAESLAKAGKDGEALAVLRRAAKAVPGGDFETAQAFLYIKPAEEFADAGKWDEALKVYEAGFDKVDPKAKKKLTEARAGVIFRWADGHEKEGEFEKALDVLRRGRALDAKDGRFQNNMLAVYDAWADKYMKQQDWAGAIRVYEGGLKEFPGDGHLTNNLDYCKQEKAKAGGGN